MFDHKFYCTQCKKETIHVKVKDSDKVAIFSLMDAWDEECIECKNKISVCDPWY